MVFNKDFRTLEAESFEVAIQKAQEERPEVVLLDIVLPRTSGLEALRRIKEFNPDCQVIMLTGLNTEGTALTAKESGAFDYIVKPFDVVDIRLKVKRALGKTREKAGSKRK